jgi:hypothetical protein
VVDVLYLADDVVVHLESRQLFKSPQVTDLDDVLVGKLQMREFPEWHVVLFKYLVVSVVLFHVLLDQAVVDDGGGH